MSVISIGSFTGTPAEYFRGHGLTTFRHILPPGLFRSLMPYKVRSSVILIPEVVVWLMMTAALTEGVMAATVVSFWGALKGILPGLSLKPVTEEAFCIARAALPVDFFRSLFEHIVCSYQQLFGARDLWHGLRLLGIDGTLVAVPASTSLRAAYGKPANQHGTHTQALLVGMVGLWSGLCHSFVLVPVGQSEQWSARFLIRSLRSGDLLLGDRNFASYLILASIFHRGAHFLIRIPANRFMKAARIPTPSGRPDEWYADLKLPAAVRKQCPHYPATMRVRILRYQKPGFRESWMVTSLLDARAFSYDQVVALYHQRWNQETFHREWKHTLQISNLRSQSKRGVLKEVFVQLTLNNLIRWLMTEAAPAGQRPVELQFLESKRLIAAATQRMAIAPIGQLRAIYGELLSEIGRCRIRVRPGRSYPRKHDLKPRNKGKGIHAQPARLLQTTVSQQ